MDGSLIAFQISRLCQFGVPRQMTRKPGDQVMVMGLGNVPPTTIITLRGTDVDDSQIIYQLTKDKPRQATTEIHKQFMPNLQQQNNPPPPPTRQATARVNE